MNENRAYQKLKAMFPAAHWQRLETWAAMGIFDSNACLHGVEAWIECKEGTDPLTSRGLIKCKVRPTQVAWEFLRRRAGGRTFVAVMVGKELYVILGENISKLKRGVTRRWLDGARINPSAMFVP
jgi:hypothetical protein